MNTLMTPPAKRLEQFEAMASEQLYDCPTLKERNSDSLDFHEVAVWTLADLMERAYQLGRKEAAK